MPFEVVPGVTAGVAAPAYAGIPVTHRDEASAVAFVTGHEDPTKPESALDWDALARFPGTLVFYMGVKNLAADRRAADRRGPRPPTSPRRWSSAARCPASARWPARWRTSRARGGGGRRARRRSRWSARWQSCASELGWLERAAAARPPRGGHARTRAGERPGGAAGARSGAEVVEAPAIRIEPRPVDGDVARAADGSRPTRSSA